MCSLHIYTASQYLIETITIRCIFSLGTDIIGKQTITFFATRNYNTILNLLKLYGSCSGHVQCIAEKCAVHLS